MTYRAQQVYADQTHITGPWYVEREGDTAVVAEGLTEYQAKVAAAARNLTDEIERADFEGCTVAELVQTLTDLCHNDDCY